MLGWEFPPLISGGLGTATEGIVRGLAANGVDVLLVLPRVAGGEERSGAAVISAGDGISAGTDVSRERGALGARRAASGAVEVRPVDSTLRPYAAGEPGRDGTRRLLERLDRGSAASDASLPLTGGYGASLGAEVERYARLVARIAERESFDVVHAHDWMTFPAGMLVKETTGKPLVVHVHASEWDRAGEHGNPGIREIEQAGFAAADRIVCVSHFTKRVVERRYRVDPARLRVVHNAVRRAARAPAEPAARAGKRAPTVLFLGRLTSQKGPAFFLAAAGLVHAARPDVRFLVAGDGDLRAALVESSAANGLARRVFFTGFLAAHEVERAYSEADVYVMPSVSEPFGIAPLEALCVDVPVIVSRQSGVAETLPSAPKVDYWDVEDLAGKVLALLERPELRRALVASGRRDLEALRWETAGARISEVYGEVLREAAR